MTEPLPFGTRATAFRPLGYTHASPSSRNLNFTSITSALSSRIKRQYFAWARKIFLSTLLLLPLRFLLLSMSDITSAGQAVAASDHPSKVKSPLPKKKKPTSAAGTKTTKKQSVDHPKYSEMVHQALSSLKERGGSSRQAVLKYIMKNFSVGSDENAVNTHLKIALRSGVKNLTLKQSKGSGATGSFRLGEEAKKKPKTAATGKKTAKKAKTPPAAKIRKTKSAAAGDKSPVKKMTKKATTKSASVGKAGSSLKTPATGKAKVAAAVAKKSKTDKPKKAAAKKVKAEKPKSASTAAGTTKVVKKPVVKKTPVGKKSTKPAGAAKKA